MPADIHFLRPQVTKIEKSTVKVEAAIDTHLEGPSLYGQ